jgi:5-hydroxyisourate hydrolase
MSLSTHVLDATTGLPAAGVRVVLESRAASDRWKPVAEAHTDDDGRIRGLGAPGAGVHRLSFDTGAYFAARAVPSFYPEVTVTFEIVDAAAHHHVPLLLSPFAYSTYRGS